MIKVKILSVGKTKERWLLEACQEYAKRLSSLVQFDTFWAKDNTQLLALGLKEESPLCLDPEGLSFSSEAFSRFMHESWEKKGARTTFIIGDATGLPEPIKKKGILLSLSPMTFTHQITRLILMEQIYRTIEIAKGSQYHK